MSSFKATFLGTTQEISPLLTIVLDSAKIVDESLSFANIQDYKARSSIR